MPCEELQAQVASLKQQIAAAEAAAQDPGGHRPVQPNPVSVLEAELQVAEQKLADCLAEFPVVAAPREILEIQRVNPSPPDQSGDWTGRVVGTSSTFPGDVDFEWLQVLDPTSEYDEAPVGASGWIIQPETSTADFEFLHPFGNDWEFYLALDVPRDGHPNDLDYQPLLALANSTDVVPSARAQTLLALPAAPTVLGVEMDTGLIPSDVLSSLNQEGSRVAVFGRWIIDTGHYYVGSGFRTEIHPPLLLVCANTQPGATGYEVTRAVFTARPFLVGQTFSTNTDTIYVDDSDDGGSFKQHMKKEAEERVLPIPVVSDETLDAHPKIKAMPFRGAQGFHLIVRPPPPKGPERPRQLNISYNFTVRTGCTVEVTSDGTEVDVYVGMDSRTYVAPALPQRSDVTVTQAQLRSESSEAASEFDTASQIQDVINTLGALFGSLDGITTDSYTYDEANALTQSGAVLNASPMSIPGTQGVTINDDQVYPVTGWLEVHWQETTHPVAPTPPRPRPTPVRPGSGKPGSVK